MISPAVVPTKPPTAVFLDWIKTMSYTPKATALCPAILRALHLSSGLLTALFLYAAITTSATAAEQIDCPLRDQPYSLDTPLIDIMLKPEARAIVNARMDGALDKMPTTFASTTPPSFSAILNVRWIAAMAHLPDEALNQIGAELASLTVTDTDRSARCARYDSEAPELHIAKGKPRLLVMEKINGFKDVPSFDAATALLKSLAKANGWSLTTTDNGAAFNPATLKQFDAVIWNNISGDVLTLEQRKAFRNYIEQGGGFLGIHGSGGDPTYFWDWYVDELIGARFIGHTQDPQFQRARIAVEPSGTGIERGLPAQWELTEEWYSFASSPRDNGAMVIATLDESSYQPVGRGGQKLAMGDHPIAWARCIGKGRSFYSAIGHVPEVYQDQHHRALLRQAIEWAAGLNHNQCDKQ